MTAPIGGELIGRVAPRLPLTARRHRPVLIGAGLLLVAGCGLGSAWLVHAAKATNAVLVVARPVPVGQVIGDGDLTVARIAADSGLSTVAAGRRRRIVGRVAAVDLLAGQLLNPAAVTTQTPPGPGEQLVGIAVKDTQRPTRLRPHDPVLLVGTPPVDADVSDTPPPSIPGTVLRVGAPDADGTTVVDVLVAATDGPRVAARAATGRIAVVVESGGR